LKATDNIICESNIQANQLSIGGTTATNGLIEINGTLGNLSLINNSYTEMTSTGIGSGDTEENTSFSLYATGPIAASEFNAISDIRVKKILNDRDIMDDIQMIKKIQTYDYLYKDIKEYGNVQKIGFVAQDLEKINKNLIKKSKRFVPNIYQQFSFISPNRISFLNPEEHSLRINDCIKIELFVDNKYCIHEVFIKNIINNTLVLKLDHIRNIDMNKKVFIYGSYVDDFLTVDINQITSVNTNIIKYLLQKISYLEDLIKDNN
jgi:hypothetical protein